MQRRITRWSAANIKEACSHSFSVYENMEGTWGIMYLTDFGFSKAYVWTGENLPAAYPTATAAIRALKRLRPDANPRIIPRIKNQPESQA